MVGCNLGKKTHINEIQLKKMEEGRVKGYTLLTLVARVLHRIFITRHPQLVPGYRSRWDRKTLHVSLSPAFQKSPTGQTLHFKNTVTFTTACKQPHTENFWWTFSVSVSRMLARDHHLFCSYPTTAHPSLWRKPLILPDYSSQRPRTGPQRHRKLSMAKASQRI